MEYWLLATIFLPLLGAGMVGLFGSTGGVDVRRLALGVSIITLGLAAWLIARFDGSPNFALYEVDWLGSATAAVNIKFAVGLDGLSLWLFGLSALLTVTSILVSWEAISERRIGFYGLLLTLETGMLGVFAARDIILFYIFFEFTLIPLFFLIGIWGSEERRYAAVKFFLFTLAGSLLTFLGLLAIVLWNHSATGRLVFSIPELTAALQPGQHPIPNDPAHGYLQLMIFLGLFAGFAIKVPLFPLHTWLPLAHVQAPTAGSVILAGILLKIGTYGFVRFSLPMLPDAAAQCAPWILWLSVAGILYGALVALAQGDIKRLIAYSSVSHLGFCMLGIFALNRLGIEGGVLQMINHGLSTGGLFAVVGMLYERYHTRQISDLGGLARRLPLLSFFMLVFTFSSIGLPGLNGFAGEFLLLSGMFQRGWAQSPLELGSQLTWIAVLSVLGVVLGAWYMLYLVQRVFFGPLKEPHGNHGGSETGHGSGHQLIPAISHITDSHAASPDHGHGASDSIGPGVPDLKLREIFALAPLVVFMVWIGVAPGYFLQAIAPAVDGTVVPAGERLYAHYGAPRDRQFPLVSPGERTGEPNTHSAGNQTNTQPVTFDNGVPTITATGPRIAQDLQARGAAQ